MIATLRWWWQQIRKPLEIAIIITLVVMLIALIVVVILGYIFNWGWTGLGPYSRLLVSCGEERETQKKLLLCQYYK